MVRNAVVGVVILLLVLVWVAPVGPMPGLFIGGEAQPVPATWMDTSGVDEILLQVGPGPAGRVVTIWVVDVDGELYVIGDRQSGWTRGIGAGGVVRMRLEGKTYTLNAVPVRENLESVFEAYVAKYKPNYPDIVAGFPSIEQAAEATAVFQLARPVNG